MSEQAAQPVFLDPEFLKCPFPMLKQIRESAPVMFVEPLNVYLVSSYDVARTVLLDTARFSNEVNIPGRSTSTAERIVEEGGYGRNRRSLQNADEPLHKVHRDLVDDAFRPKRIRQMADYVSGIVAELVDAIVAGGSATDVVHDFAIPLPLIVIADQLGVPREMYRTFKAWSDAWLAGLGTDISEQQMIDAAHLVVDMQQYLAARIEERRSAPQDDILSDLAHAQIDGAPVPTGTILGIVEQLLVAGNETTTNGIAAGLHLLATRSELHDRLRAETTLVSEFTEEVLRAEAPVQALFRRVVADTELAGVALPAGSILMVHYGAASRDEAKFENADWFDLDRSKKGAHLAFGSGIHHCVGSELARAEMRLEQKVPVRPCLHRRALRNFPLRNVASQATVLR